MPYKTLSTDYADCKSRFGRMQGNFYPLAAERVDEWSMNGMADEYTGTVEYGPGYVELFTLTWSDMIEILAYSGPLANAAIRLEDDRGFVNVIFYDTVAAAMVDFTWMDATYERLAAEDEEGL